MNFVLHATQSKIPTSPVYFAKEVILTGERMWNDIPTCESYDGHSLPNEISKLVMIKINEKLRALFIGILWFQNCGKHFRSPEKENSRTWIGFNTFTKEITR